MIQGGGEQEGGVVVTRAEENRQAAVVGVGEVRVMCSVLLEVKNL